MKKTLLVLAGLAAVLIAAMAASRRPVLLSLSDPSELSGNPMLVVMNPFRDRAPERAADAMLQALRENPAQALAGYSDISARIIEKEREYRIRDWRIAGRTDAPAMVTLVYQPLRDPGNHVGQPIVLQVSKQGSQWRVTDFTPGGY